MKKRGFTMVEVIIVVAIIAILASIIMPKMSGSRDRASLNACKQNLLKIGLAMEMYANEYTRPTPWDGSGSSRVDYLDCTYLVPVYLKTNPRCPLGNRYNITANHPGWFLAPAGSYLIYCYTYGAAKHNGLVDAKPYYWVGGKVTE